MDLNQDEVSSNDEEKYYDPEECCMKFSNNASNTEYQYPSLKKTIIAAFTMSFLLFCLFVVHEILTIDFKPHSFFRSLLTMHANNNPHGKQHIDVQMMQLPEFHAGSVGMYGLITYDSWSWQYNYDGLGGQISDYTGQNFQPAAYVIPSTVTDITFHGHDKNKFFVKVVGVYNPTQQKIPIHAGDPCPEAGILQKYDHNGRKTKPSSFTADSIDVPIAPDAAISPGNQINYPLRQKTDYFYFICARKWSNVPLYKAPFKIMQASNQFPKTQQSLAIGKMPEPVQKDQSEIHIPIKPAATSVVQGVPVVASTEGVPIASSTRTTQVLDTDTAAM